MRPSGSVERESNNQTGKQAKDQIKQAPVKPAQRDSNRESGKPSDG
jgi:hypothetical protein